MNFNNSIIAIQIQISSSDVNLVLDVKEIESPHVKLSFQLSVQKECSTCKDEYESLVISLEGLDVRDMADDPCEGVATDSIPSVISIDADSLINLEILVTMHLPINSSMTLQSSTDDADWALFKMLACQVDQKAILLGIDHV